MAVSAAGAASTTRVDSRSRTIERPGDGVAVALVIVLWLVTLAIWVTNPFAAALLVPALHLWLWAIDPDLPDRPAGTAGDARARAGAGRARRHLLRRHAWASAPSDLIWSAALLVAGHAVSLLAALEWCVVLGCLVSAATLVLAAARRPKAQPAAVTVRGPITYAGPARSAAPSRRCAAEPIGRRAAIGAAWHHGDAMRRLIRDVSSVLILSGLLLVVDAGATLVWQEPVTAAIGMVLRSDVNKTHLSYRTAPAVDHRHARPGRHPVAV